MEPELPVEPLASVEADPILLRAALPLRATFFPLGFPLEIATNSPSVLAAANDSWGHFHQRFDHPPLTILLGVSPSPDVSTEIPSAPVCRSRGHLMSHIADAYNFVHCDLNTGFAFGWVTPQTAGSTLYLRYFFIEATTLSLVAALRAAPLHAACISSHGHGMLLCGDSGAGKSSLAFAGARSGWTFTCDDASYLLFDRPERMVVGNCHQFRLRDSGAQLFPELEGRSITPRATGKPSIEIPTAELPELNTSESTIVQSIIFLNRQDAHYPQLIPFSHEKALAWFQQFLYSSALTYRAQRAAITRLLDVPVFELFYTDLDWAIERLNRLALTGS